MTTRVYLRASTKEQDSFRAEAIVNEFMSEHGLSDHVFYVENFSGTKINRPELNRLLEDSNKGDLLLVESVDRLTRLSQADWSTLKRTIEGKGLRLVVVDLPTTHQQTDDSITGAILSVINNMLIDLLATMARLDQEKRVERIKQGQARAKLSGTAIGGRSKDQDKRTAVMNVIEKYPDATKQEIVKLSGVSRATVYRILKENL